MDPILTVLRVGSLERPVGGFGVMLSLALLVGATISTRAAARAKIDVGAAIALVGFLAAGGFAGGYALFVVVEWARGASPLDALAGGGIVYFGALGGGAIAAWRAARLLEIPLGRWIDVAIPALPAAQAVGRLGCFLGGCCYGAPWDGPFAVRYVHPLAPASMPSVFRHPVPLYESAALWMMAIGFVLIPPRRVGQGRRFLVYLALYSVIRFGLEFLRGDEVRGVFWNFVSTSQLIAVAVFVVSGFMLVRRSNLSMQGFAAGGVAAGGVAAGSFVAGSFVVLSVLGLAVLVPGLGVGKAQPTLALSASRIAWIEGGWSTRGSDAQGIRHAFLMCIANHAGQGGGLSPGTLSPGTLSPGTLSPPIGPLSGSSGPGSSGLGLGGLASAAPIPCVEEVFAEEIPARRIWTGAFGIDRTEVSVASYRRCVVAGRCAPSRASEIDRRIGSDDHPVTGVTWHDARRFCAFAGGRLPTEAEWERASRGSDGRLFPWGNVFNDRLSNHGRVSSHGPGGLSAADDMDGYRYAAPVHAFAGAASPYGVLNLAGNVWEWTRDRFQPESYKKGPRINPRGPRAGGERVVRGGSWRSPPYTHRSAHRVSLPAGFFAPDLGFRCAYKH